MPLILIIGGLIWRVGASVKLCVCPDGNLKGVCLTDRLVLSGDSPKEVIEVREEGYVSTCLRVHVHWQTFFSALPTLTFNLI